MLKKTFQVLKTWKVYEDEADAGIISGRILKTSKVQQRNDLLKSLAETSQLPDRLLLNK